jgi:cysteine desulfurase
VRIYLDHNATTPLRAEVRAFFESQSEAFLGNPSSLHASGRRARHWIDEARERIAGALGVHEEEVFFTSGGTEGANLAIAGTLLPRGRGAGLVTSAIEHSAVLATAAALERAGHPVERVGVDAAGKVVPEALQAALSRPSTQLVSIQSANGEIGVVQDVASVAALARERVGPQVLVHTDGVQALGRTGIPLGAGGADLASFSAHKIGGPVGVGVLYRRRGVASAPLFFGGGQEGGLRPGTENALGVAAAALALELAVREQALQRERTLALSLALWTELARRLPEARLIGPALSDAERLANTLCIDLGVADGKVLVTRLDLEGLELSAGSACASGSLEPSHVLLALGLDERAARRGLRVSLGWNTTAEDCKRAVDILVKVAHATRAS